MLSRRSKVWLVNTALVVVSVGVTCGVGELFLRFFMPQPLQSGYTWPDGTMRHYPSFSFRYSRDEFSNVVSFNNIGMRGPDVVSHKAADTTRLLVMGDSFVDAKQVADDEVLTAVMNNLSGHAGYPLEVINLGKSGYGQDRELYLWKKLGRSLEPDIVVLAFYANDVRNNLDGDFWELRDGELVELKQPRPPRRRWRSLVGGWLAAHSHLYVTYKLTKKRLEKGPFAIENEIARDFIIYSDTEQSRTGWELTLALLTELRNSVRDTGAEFVLVAIPEKYQVDSAQWRAFTELAGVGPNGYDRRAPQNRLRSWASRTGTPFIDLYDEFRARNVNNSFYYTIDGHWNPDGHRLAAEVIMKGLRDFELIGDRPTSFSKSTR